MKNTQINLKVIGKIAKALGELNDRVVYVGGAIVSVYINDPAAEDIRPTKDIDITLEILTLAELENLRILLNEKGFSQTSDANVMCRFMYDDITVDVMSTKAVGWAPADQWFAPGFKEVEKLKVEAQQIRILPLAYFLATKFSAFHDRGAKEPRASKDFEDITYILDNRIDLVEQIINSPQDVRKYLQLEFESILNDRVLQEAVIANLFYETQVERYKIIADKLLAIVYQK
ncbi:MAG: nucleotidyl transferase AbiEii/AbiGii toxin family protein [Bacteroidota bacterium]